MISKADQLYLERLVAAIGPEPKAEPPKVEEPKVEEPKTEETVDEVKVDRTPDAWAKRRERWKGFTKRDKKAGIKPPEGKRFVHDHVMKKEEPKKEETFKPWPLTELSRRTLSDYVSKSRKSEQAGGKNRTKGLLKAFDRLQGKRDTRTDGRTKRYHAEEAITELSKKTLGSYLKYNVGDQGAMAANERPWLMKGKMRIKFQRRRQGHDTAVDKLTGHAQVNAK